MLKSILNNKAALFGIQRRNLHSQLLSTTGNGVRVHKLVNDRDHNTEKDEYIDISLKQLHEQLNQDRYYIFVDKAKLASNGDLYPGHIASFFTDLDGKIVEESCVSLRRGEKIKNQELVYTLTHDAQKIERVVSVWKIKFISIDLEFEKNFLRHAHSQVPGKERFLIEIPFSLIKTSTKDLLENTELMKEKYRTQRFILCNGQIGKKPVQALNCVKGFYGSHKLRGTIENPSPQMGSWSYLRYIMGALLRDEVINSTGLRMVGLERTMDDVLEYDQGFGVTTETISRLT